jgi:TRAP transporter 4TM/12TM fusion protein
MRFIKEPEIMRTLGKRWQILIGILSGCLVAFQIFTSGFGLLSDLIQRSIHMAFVLSLCFILKPPTKKSASMDYVPFYDILLALLSFAGCAFILINNDTILWKPLVWLNGFDKVFAVLTIILILEASRRTVGWIFPIMGTALFLYAYLGAYIPGRWHHKGFSLNYIFQSLYHTSNGIWGTMVGLAATMLAMFGIFGAVLSITGGAKTFIKLGLKATGKSTGGPGKVAVVASCLFGMVSGSAMGNVVATGTFTIPMMKTAGFHPQWAGAIEAVSSTGGQIMPPIMASTAFIMAQILGISYLSVAKAAFVPALLYFGSEFVCVHFYAKMHNIKGIKADDEKITFFEMAIIIAPLISFLYFIARGYSVIFSAYYATLLGIGTCIVSYIFAEKKAKPILMQTGHLINDSARKGAQNIVDMSTLLAGSQLSICLISMTGLGIKLSDMIVSIGDKSLFLCLVISMMVCIVLGMGLPTPAVYVIAAAILVPPLIKLGIDPFVAHLFMIFFSSLASITPPVCARRVYGGRNSGANWFKTGITAVGIALPGFVVPFIFIYNDSILLRRGALDNTLAVVTAVIGVFFISTAIVGYINKKLRLPARWPCWPAASCCLCRTCSPAQSVWPYFL